MNRQSVLIHYAYPPVIGGVEFVMESHASLIAADGGPVKVLAGAGASKLKGVSFKRLPELGADGSRTKLVQRELAKA